MRNGALGRLTSGIAVEAEEGGAQQEKGGEGNVARRSEKISIEQSGRVFAGIDIVGCINFCSGIDWSCF